MARGSGLPYFYAHLRRLLGREPTQAEVAGAIAVTEANPRLTGPQDANNILAAIYNRAQAEGRIDARAYDGVSFRRNPAGGAGLYNKITAKNLAPYASIYKNYQSGGRALPHQQTHYWHPSAMNAIYRKNPRMVRSSPRGNLSGFGRTSIPRWHNPKSAYYAGGRHEGVFTTPRHLAGKVPPRKPSSDMGTDAMLAALKQHNQNNPPLPGRMALGGPTEVASLSPPAPPPAPRPAAPAPAATAPRGEFGWAGTGQVTGTPYVEGAPPAVPWDRGVTEDTPRGSEMQERLPWAGKAVGGKWQTQVRGKDGMTDWERAQTNQWSGTELSEKDRNILEFSGAGKSNIMSGLLGKLFG